MFSLFLLQYAASYVASYAAKVIFPLIAPDGVMLKCVYPSILIPFNLH